MIGAVPQFDALDADPLDAPLQGVRRVLTLIHDEPASRDIAPEVATLERMRADFVLRFETKLLTSLAALLDSAEAGVPVDEGRLLPFVDSLKSGARRFHDARTLARKAKSQVKDPRLKAELARVVALLEAFLVDLRRISKRYKTEVQRLSRIDPGQASARKSAMMYAAALERRGFKPRLSVSGTAGGPPTYVLTVSPLPSLASDPASLLAFEEAIHDEIEQASPGLVGLTIMRWTDVNQAA